MAVEFLTSDGSERDWVLQDSNGRERECGVFVENDAQSVAGGRCEWCETETWKLPSVVTTGDRVASITESRCHRSPNQRA
jgi:D-serine deaminase-like pyridoxal phosphate-dependent protein